MKKGKYMPYYFDRKYEYRTYKNIGVEYRILKQAEKNIFCKLRWKVRKFMNAGERNYKNFDKYSEWEAYVNSLPFMNSSNKTDLLRFLQSRARLYDFARNIVGSIVTPFYAVLLSGALAVLIAMPMDKITYVIVLYIWGFFCILLFVLLVFLYKMSWVKSNWYYFYRDYIEIVQRFLA